MSTRRMHNSNGAAVAAEEPVPAESTRGEPAFRPAIDIYETANELVLEADVPGSTPEAIDVRFEDRVLTVRAEVASRQASDTNWLAREYRVGPWERSFRLGEDIDAGRIDAQYRDGVLTLSLPKAEHVRPRKIEVRTN